MNLTDQRRTFIINFNNNPSCRVRNRYSLASSEFRWIKSGRKVLRCIKLQPKLSPGKVPEPFPSSFVDPRRTETKNRPRIIPFIRRCGTVIFCCCCWNGEKNVIRCGFFRLIILQILSSAHGSLIRHLPADLHRQCRNGIS